MFGPGDWFNVFVTYNRAPMAETDAVRLLKQFRALASTRVCNGIRSDRTIQPGEEHLNQMNVTEFYNMSKPGTYEVTVTRETEPRDLQMSTTTKSNTVKIVVP
jgi:hypothetical protein